MSEASSGPAGETAGPASPAGVSISVEQSAKWRGILPIALLNAALNVITLTLWRFWGRTRVRRYLWSTTKLNGLPLEYTGTGFELFRSFLFVMFAIILPIYAVTLAGQLLLPPERFMIYFGLAYFPLLLGFYWLLGAAVWIARRYRLSRTSWRGIRFAQIGSISGYAWASIGYGLLTSITLGWFEPAREMRLTRRLWTETWYGDQTFSAEQENSGLAASLWWPYALFWFSGLIGYGVFIAVYMALIMPLVETGSTEMEMSFRIIASIYAAMFAGLAVVGLFAMPYQAALLRRKAEIVSLGGLNFRIRSGTFSLAWIHIVNTVIIVLTLGFGVPIAQMRLWRYIFSRLEIEGEIALDSIAQNPVKGPGSGEGLADAFDIGNVI